MSVLNEEILKEKFYKLNYHFNDLLTSEDLLNCFDSLVEKFKKEFYFQLYYKYNIIKVGHIFDRDIARQIIAKIEKKRDGKFNLHNSFKVLIQAENILLRKFNKSNELINDFLLNKEEAIKKLIEIEKNEKMNENNIMIESSLSLTIKEAQNLKGLNWDGNLDPYVILSCGKDKVQTDVAHSTNPVWNVDCILY